MPWYQPCTSSNCEGKGAAQCETCDAEIEIRESPDVLHHGIAHPTVGALSRVGQLVAIIVVPIEPGPTQLPWPSATGAAWCAVCLLLRVWVTAPGNRPEPQEAGYGCRRQHLHQQSRRKINKAVRKGPVDQRVVVQPQVHNGGNKRYYANDQRSKPTPRPGKHPRAQPHT